MSTSSVELHKQITEYIGKYGKENTSTLLLYQAANALKSLSEQSTQCSMTRDLSSVREQLLAPRTIVRDDYGCLNHPAIPVCDEGVRYDDLLAAFGIETTLVSMENDVSSEEMDRYYESNNPDCSFWTPSIPSGDNWLLLEIYDTEDGPFALYGRAMPVDQWPRRGQRFDLRAHLTRQINFSFTTFGPGIRTAGVVDHIRRELLEIEENPENIEEWIDVAILALDGAWRSRMGSYQRHIPSEHVGLTAEAIIKTLVTKQKKNEGRSWPDWRYADPNKAIEHDRSKDAQKGKGES